MSEQLLRKASLPESVSSTSLDILSRSEFENDFGRAGFELGIETGLGVGVGPGPDLAKKFEQLYDLKQENFTLSHGRHSDQQLASTGRLIHLNDNK